MRTIVGLLFVGVGVLGWSLMANAKVQDQPDELRAAARQDMSQNNWADALEKFQQLTLDEAYVQNSLPSDFDSALQCFQNLNRTNEIDAYRESVADQHASDAAMLHGVASSWMEVDHFGFLIAGEFHRGGHRGGGKYASARERDRVRSLQLFKQAADLIESAIRNDEPVVSADTAANLYDEFANAVLSVIGEGAWKLQDLTDLSKLPDYDDTAPQYGWGRFSPSPVAGAPVDAEGNPIYHSIPASWDAAKSDGERWRWLLEQIVRHQSDRRSAIDFKFAQFLRGQFGVSQGVIGGPPVLKEGEELPADDAPRTSGIWMAHTLDDSETIAQLATGTKRFTLPDEFNFLKIIKRLAAEQPNVAGNVAQSALQELIEIRMSRHQYPQAAELLAERIRRFGDDVNQSWKQRRDQIIGNWCRILQQPTQPAGTGATFEMEFRNGEQLSFEARRINIDTLLQDVQDYLRSNPQRLDGQKLQISQLGYRLIVQDESKYVGGVEATWKTDLRPAPLHFDRGITVTSPLQDAGAYLVTATINDGNTARIVVWVADLAITKKQVDDGTLFFVADAVTGTPAAAASLEFFGYQQRRIQGRQYQVTTTRFAKKADTNGLTVPDPRLLQDPNRGGYSWLTIARTNDGRLAYDGFSGIWGAGGSRRFNYSAVKVYSVTDRPVYRPKHTVKFRQWLRHVEFHREVEGFADQDFVVRIANPRGDIVYETEVRTDKWAGVSGEWEIPQDAVLGNYSLQLCGTDPNRSQIGSGSFRIEEYRKPEFEVTVAGPDEPIALGDTITAKIEARYYFGSPVTEGKVHYKVERTAKDARWYPVARWDWFYGTGYWWFAPEYDWYPGFKRWGCFAPIPPWWGAGADPPELVAEGDTRIGPDGTIEIEIDTATAKLNHPDTDHNYHITAEVVDQSRRTIIGTGDVIAAREPFKVFVWTHRGHYRTGDTVEVGYHVRTADGKPVKGSAEITLLSITYDGDVPTETPVQQIDAEANDAGGGTAKLTAREAGQYRIRIRYTDEEGRTIEGGYILFIRGPGGNGGDFHFNDLELITDKREYAPGETVSLMVNTDRLNGTVLLFVRAANGVCPQPQVLRLDGKSTTVEIAVEQSDLPNFFVEALTISNGKLHSQIREVIVPPEERVADVEVLPSAETYLPGEDAEVKVRLRTIEGEPFVGNTVLAVYDKSVDAIAGSSAIGDIREFFWKIRRSHYLRIDTTLNRTEYPVSKPGEITMQPMYSQPPGDFGMGFGGGGAMGGEMLMRSRGAVPMTADAPMMKSEAAAEGAPAAAMMMDAAGAPAASAAPNVAPAVRSNFADTAFWAGDLVADADGIATVKFPMPDSLTTWRIRAWAMGDGTRVGQGEADVIVRKNLIVRPQIPRFLTETDELVLSAVVRNDLPNPKRVTVKLDAAQELIAVQNDLEHVVEIEAGGEVRVDWLVKVVGSGSLDATMSALTDEESDAAKLTVPVLVHGMLKTESWAGTVRPDADSQQLAIRVPSERNPEQSRLEIRYSPTLAGAMVDALPYLIDYPYGCTEQTLNRFVPAVITQQTLIRMQLDLEDIRRKQTNLNAQEIGDPAKRAAQWKRFKANPVFDPQELGFIVADGVRRLTDMQLSDGGWGWFSGFGEQSTAHLTAQVVHGLTLASRNDVAIPEDVIQRGVAWLQAQQQAELEKLREGDWRRDHPDELKNRRKPYKMSADNMDAFVAIVLSEHQQSDKAMDDYLYRDRGNLSVYSLALTGLLLHHREDFDRRNMVIRNIEQFLVQDDENDTAWLNLPQNNWWYWYGSEIESHAAYLKLLVAARPNTPVAPMLVKYLLNNRKHGTYWNSTRDTALTVEAFADFIKATGEDRPNMTVEVVIDGQVAKAVEITAENIFSFDNALIIEGVDLTDGAHTVELRRRGTGPVYFNVYLTNFTKERQITAAGLEVKVERRYFRLVRDDKQENVAGSRGQLVDQKSIRYRREPLANLDMVTSGDLIEVELIVDSKNDYEYLLLEDRKPSGFEPDDQRSGYVFEGLRAYRELRDQTVTFFLQSLARGRHSISYRIRAEAPGTMAALPAKIEGMYAPELVGNSDEQRLRVEDRDLGLTGEE